MSKYEGAKRGYRQAVACTANAYSSAWPIEKCREYLAEEVAAEAALDDAVEYKVAQGVAEHCLIITCTPRDPCQYCRDIARSLIEQEQKDE